MLINYNGKYTDVSTRRPRAGPHDAELLLEQDAAVSARAAIRSSSPRSRRRSTRRCSSTTCSRSSRTRHAARAPRQLPREHQGHRLPPDAVRRVRAARCTRWPQKGQPLTGDVARQALPRHHAQVLRPRSGRLHRRRLHRARVELHPALLPRLLRVPVRDVVHRVGRARGEGQDRRSRRAQALPGVPQRRRIEVSRSICSRTPAWT